MDSWQQQKIVCLTIMSVEDVEDVYTFELLITGFRLFGVGGYLAYRVIRKTWAAVQSINTQTEMLREQNRKLDTILKSHPGSDWTQSLKDVILEKFECEEPQTCPPGPGTDTEEIRATDIQRLPRGLEPQENHCQDYPNPPRDEKGKVPGEPPSSHSEQIQPWTQRPETPGHITNTTYNIFFPR
ncbi:hypothetical protein CRENBAI_003653 [Crenichthys baileyi]|uniref:Uncharacterized protein n=1 Tax=Crenichthys baileyi TaxID=28760 RepID=A0AAV9R7Y1_9TELE